MRKKRKGDKNNRKRNVRTIRTGGWKRKEKQGKRYKGKEQKKI
jgi:hypothetical protein